MAATSVTGRGLGSVDKRQKGSEHLTLGVEKLIGPRPVAVGRVTLDGSGDARVDYPVLPGVAADYVVVASDTNVSTAAAVGASLAITSDGSTLTFKGTAAHVVMYALFNTGLALGGTLSV